MATTLAPVNGRATTQAAGAFIQVVTPEMARTYLEQMSYERQRTIRQDRVSGYAKQMRDGAWSPRSVIEFAQFGGRQMLVNGQHRLSAVVKAGIAQEFVIVIHSATTADEVAALYARLDTGIRRGDPDYIRAMGLSDELDLSDRLTRKLGAATRFLESGCIGSRGANGTLNAGLMRTYAPYLKEFIGLAAGCDSQVGKSLDRAATLGIGLLTLRFARQHEGEAGGRTVREFWRGAFFDDGVAHGDARKLAYRHLLTTVTYGRQSKYNVMIPHDSARYLAGCFNAYMEGREAHRMRIQDDLALWGVPRDVSAWLA